MTERTYQPHTINFEVPVTIDGMVIYDSAGGDLGVTLRRIDGEWVVVHECTPPDAARAETDTWICPDCRATAVLKTLRWWEPLGE